MINYYRYATLDPRPSGEFSNGELADRRNLFGLEVSVPKLAALCDLGNLDPQHTGGDATTAAIEAALTLPESDLPPPGATLVTVRPDADALGAMAVLLLRAVGEDLTPQIRVGIAKIAIADKEASDLWHGPRPMGAAKDLVSPTGPVAAVAMDPNLPLEERICVLVSYLRTGTFDYHPPGGQRVGEADVYQRLIAEAEVALDTLDAITITGGRIVVVTGDHPLAMEIGYRCAPIILATNPRFRFQGGQPHRKHTIARWNTSIAMGWDAMRRELREVEPGWGGSTSIFGSPQGTDSTLSTDEVLDVVQRHLPSA